MKTVSFIFLLALSLVGVSQSLTDSLLLYYPMNGNCVDASGNGFNAALVNADLTTDRFGNPNSAYHFNGVDQYIDWPASAELQPELPISVSFWIKFDTTNAVFGSTFHTNFVEDNYSGVWMTLDPTGRFNLNFGDASGSIGPGSRRTKTGTTVVQQDVWYFVVGVVRGASDMDIFLNCVNDGGIYSGTGGDLGYLPVSGRLGEHDSNLSDPSYHLMGTLDEFRFWNRALTVGEINSLCTQTCSVDLGPDQSFCQGELATLDATTVGASYLWSTGETSSTISVSTTDSYWVEVNVGGCVANDTINMDFNNNPSLNLNDSLLLYYPMNGNCLDSSGNGFNAALVNADLTTDRFGNPNGAYHFNGIDQNIDWPITTQLQPELPISVSYWVKFDDAAYSHRVIFDSDFEQNINSGVWMGVTAGGNFYISYGDASGSIGSSSRRSKIGTTVVQDSTWYHVVGVINGSTEMELYVNCVNDSGYYDGSGGNIDYTNSAGSIGRVDGDLYNPAYQFKGTLDEFKFWNRSLTLCDISALCAQTCSVDLGPDQTFCQGESATLDATTTGATYLWSTGETSSTISVSTTDSYWVEVNVGGCVANDTINMDFNNNPSLNLNDSLLLYYPMNGNCLDSSGNGYDAVVVNADLTTDRFGNANGAYHFNGVDQYIDWPASPELQPELPISVSFWVKFDDAVYSHREIFDNDFEQNINSGVWMGITAGGNFYISYGDASGSIGSSSRRSKIGTTVAQDSTWYHVVGVINGPTDMELYVNCINDSGYYDGSGGNIDYTSAAGSLGRVDGDLYNPAYQFKGTLDEFKFWNRSLTLCDISALCAQTCSVDLGPDQTICEGETAILDATTVGATYNWGYGMGTFPIISVSPVLTTNYWVEVNVDGCIASDTVTVVVNPLPDVNFFYNSLGTQVTFSLSTNPANQYFWLFGDGTSSNDSIPSHIYSTEGYYDVFLSVVDTTTGCSSHITDVVMTESPQASCLADFSYTVLGNTVSFTDLSLGSPNQWNWQFGDAAFLTDQNPEHIYSNNGIYKVTLTIFNSVTNCMDIVVKYIEVNIVNGCSADFIYHSDSLSQTVAFTNLSLGNNSEYVWNFGDGSTSTDANPIHQYVDLGYYNVCLSIYDTLTSCYDITCQQVQIGNSDDCVADFIYVVDYLTNTVQFFDQSFGNPDEWNWNFGDGGQSIEQNPIYTYGSAGDYMVHLNIKNHSTHCIEHINMLINVSSDTSLIGEFGYVLDSTYNNKNPFSTTVQFMGTSIGEASRFMWDFGDGVIDSTTNSPKHEFGLLAEYAVCLYVSNVFTQQTHEYCAKVALNTGVSDGNSVRKLHVYPNPTDDYLVIENLPQNAAAIVVTSVSGSVLIKNAVVEKIDVAKLKAGCYFVQIHDGNGNVIDCKRFVKL